MITGEIHDKESLMAWSGRVIDLYHKHGSVNVAASHEHAFENKYSKKQRGSLHVWCDMCAKTLNDNNIECELINPVTKVQYSMPWTGNLFKENVYKYILLAMTGKDSTEKQNTVDPSQVAMVIAKRYSENGVVLPEWPSNR